MSDTNVLLERARQAAIDHQAAANEREATPPRFVISFDGWKMRDYKKFAGLADEGKGAEESITLGMQMMARCVKAWPFAGDPTNPDDYEDLTLAEFGEVTEAANKAAEDTFRVPEKRGR